LTITGGAEAFNGYAARLHGLGPLLKVAELVLLAMAVVHVLTGAFLFFDNLKARPERYAMVRRAGGRTVGSATMPYTGLGILCFVIFHLTNFHFVDKSQTTVFELVAEAFADPFHVGVYVAAMVVVALHVSHGLWSAFHSLGANHARVKELIFTGAWVFAMVLGLGFGLLPIYVALTV
jgi:succinate dehydrogenase / fumarate reductase cytochrome b subunit